MAVTLSVVHSVGECEQPLWGAACECPFYHELHRVAGPFNMKNKSRVQLK